ncbi:MAG: hypothetical protein ACE5JB_07795 [bacterium]
MKNIKSTILFSIILLLGLNFLKAGAIIIDFHGEPGYNKVTLKWTTQNEINLKGFEVQRGFDNKNDKDFKAIGFVKTSIEKKDKKNYSFEDKSVFKQIERTFYYRLKILDNDGSFSYSKQISVTPTISSVRQTWGSIKAMFR